MARLLKQTTLTEEQWEYVKSISQSGETLLNIINDILDVSKIGTLRFPPHSIYFSHLQIPNVCKRIEKNMLQLEHAAFDVRECLSDTLATFNVPAQQKRITLSSFVDSSIPSLVVQDKSRVSQVLFNLLGIYSLYLFFPVSRVSLFLCISRFFEFLVSFPISSFSSFLDYFRLTNQQETQ